MELTTDTGSASGRPWLQETYRRQLDYLDARRRGASEAPQLLDRIGAAAWQVEWGTAVDLDPRLRLKLHVGPVKAARWGEFGGHPHIAVVTREAGTPDTSPAYQLRVWDVISEQSRTLAASEPCACVSFAVVAGEPVLVSGHDGGLLRIWNATDGTLRQAFRTGPSHVVDLYVTESDRAPQVVTLDAAGRVRCWSLSNGQLLRELDAPRPFCISGARLVDGRDVLVTCGARLSLWDLDRGERLPLLVPQEWTQPRTIQLSASDGSDRITIVDASASITTYDLATGTQIGTPITAHRVYRPNGRQQMWTGPYPHPKVAIAAGTLAVPTPTRVHLWDLTTSQEKSPPIVGLVGHVTTATVRWHGHELLLTGSRDDGVVALWELDQPVTRPPGHEHRVRNLAMAAPADVVVSTDEGGTIVARDGIRGQLAFPPLATGLEDTRAMVAWPDEADVVVATGVGSSKVSDGYLRQWNLSSGRQRGDSVKAHLKYLQWLVRVRLRDRDVLVTYGPDGQLKLWQADDGMLIDEVETGISSRVTGFATGFIDGAPVVAMSSVVQPMRVHSLDDLSMRPTIIPEAGSDIVLAVNGSYIVAGNPDPESSKSYTYRVWHTSGAQVGPDGTSGAEIVAAAIRTWPAVYLAKADGTVSLANVETGHDLCSPMLLPSRASALAVAGNGDLVVGFGCDVVRIRPPVD